MTLLATVTGAATGLLIAASTATAYSEYQKFSQANSGRVTNCAMCHTHPDGPDGAAFGQIGSLNATQLQELNRARAAFQPGQEVDNPILNDFGDSLIERLGKAKVIELKSRPEDLAVALGHDSDLDADGIADAREFLDGTHPLKASSGDPWRLFVNNLSTYRFHVFMIALATLITMYGIGNLLRAWHSLVEATAKNSRHSEE
jgi:cytochrome c553